MHSLLLAILMASMMSIASIYAATSQRVDICTSAGQITSLAGALGANVQQIQQIQQQMCGTSGAATTQCGNSNNQLANIMVCALGSKTCGITPQNQNQLMAMMNTMVPQLAAIVPQMNKILTNPIVCAIVQQSCCLSAGVSNVDLANILAGVISNGQTTNVMSVVNSLLQGANIKFPF